MHGRTFERRRVGETGLEVTALGLGGASLAGIFSAVPADQARATVRHALNAGITYVDTAPQYGLGRSEHLMGEVVREASPRPVISTKVGRLLQPVNPAHQDKGNWVDPLPFNQRYNYSYDAIMRSYEDSLQRLGLNRIDLLLIHDLDWWHHGTDAAVDAWLAQLRTSGWRALEELKSSGAIRGIGAGVNQLGTIPRFLDIVDVDFFLLALRYTLMEQDTLETELPACAKRDVGIVVGGVFSSGITATGAVSGAKYNYADADGAALEKVRRIEAICAAHGVPLPAAALQFPLGHPLVASVIPGAFSPAHITTNLEHMRWPIPADLWAELKHERLIREDAPTPQ